MILDLEPGIENHVSRTVREEDIASWFGEEHMPVLATSKIVAFMEYVALSSIQSRLPEGFSTVGTDISLQHKRAVVSGQEVECYSRLTDIKGRYLYFEISLRSEGEEIAYASHTRSVINIKAYKRLLGGK